MRFVPSISWCGATILIGLVLLAPWWFGGIEAPTQLWLMVGGFAVLVAAGIKSGIEDSWTTPLPLLLYVAMAAAGWGLLQLIPLSPEVYRSLSPGSARYAERLLLGPETKEDLQLAATVALPPAPSRRALSFYPASTRHDVALLLLAASVMFSSAVLLRTAYWQRAVCWLVALNGGALAFFGMLQKLAWNGRLYWIVPLSAGSPFGPYVNRNNAAGYLLLCLGAALAVVWQAGQRSRARQGTLLTPAILTAASLAGLILAGLLGSFSRGGILAGLAATLVMGVAVLRTRHRSGWLMPVVLVLGVGVGIVGWVGMTGSIGSRLATMLAPQKIAQEGRLPHWRDTLAAVPDFWRTGSGLGTYRYVYLPYQRHLEERRFFHAENQYLEALVEAGVAGPILILACVGLMAAAARRLLRQPDVDLASLGLVGGFAITGQAVAASFDFGLYLPANFLLLAVLAGMIGGKAVARAGPASEPVPSRPGRRLVGAGTLVLLLAGSGWAIADTWTFARVATAVRQSNVEPENLNPDVLREKIDSLTAAARQRPDDAEIQRRLADLWITRYSLRTKDGASTADSLSRRGGSPLAVHGTVYRYWQDHAVAELTGWRRSSEVAQFLHPALKHTLLAQRCCPLDSEGNLRLGALSVLAADPPGDEIYLERARRLTPWSPLRLFATGLLEYQAGRLDGCWRDWRRSLEISPEHLNSILAWAGPRLVLPGMVERLLPDDPEMLLGLAETRYGSEGEPASSVRHHLAERSEDLLGSQRRPEEERLRLEGRLYAARRQYPEAIERYRQAVSMRPLESQWRYEFALLLRDHGSWAVAYEQARTALLLAPDRWEYRRLLRQLQRNSMSRESTAPAK